MLKKHPKGLISLFFTESWERFGFYGMRALLPLYMFGAIQDGALGWSNKTSMQIYGWYIGVAYVTTLLGGWFADKMIGQRRSIILGGFLMALGYFSLALGSMPSFFAGLVLICFGNGFFKPCVTSMLGGLYEKNDVRRDSGYSIFYMGINLGAFVGPFICGTLQGLKGYQWGFAAAGVGMLISIIVFWHAQKSRFGTIGLAPNRKAIKETPKVPLNKQEKSNILVLTIIAMFTILFMVAFEQAGGLLALYADKYTDRNLLGFMIPTAWFQSLNPFFIVVLAPVMSWVWSQFAKYKNDLSMAVKVSLGFFLTAISFAFMMGAAVQFGAIGKSALVWLVAFNFFCTLGELCINPIVWSNVSKLAPTRYISSMMAIILVCIGMGGYLSGFVGSYVDDLGPYQIFGGITALMTVTGFALLALNKKLKSMTHVQIESQIEKAKEAIEEKEPALSGVGAE